MEKQFILVAFGDFPESGYSVVAAGTEAEMEELKAELEPLPSFFREDNDDGFVLHRLGVKWAPVNPEPEFVKRHLSFNKRSSW